MRVCAPIIVTVGIVLSCIGSLVFRYGNPGKQTLPEPVIGPGDIIYNLSPDEFCRSREAARVREREKMIGIAN